MCAIALAVAGCARMPFSRLGLRALYQRSSGIPRLINIIADRALMAGYAREQDIDRRAPRRSRRRRDPARPRALLAAPLRPLGRCGCCWCSASPRGVLRCNTHRTPAPAARAGAGAVVPPPSGRRRCARHRGQPAEGTGNRADAWTPTARALAGHVDAVSVRDASRCQTMMSPGINCLRGHATLDQLARFDRPLILLLQHATEHPAYALLQGAGNSTCAWISPANAMNLRALRCPSSGTAISSRVWRLPDDVPAEPAARRCRAPASPGSRAPGHVRRRQRRKPGRVFRCRAGGARAQAADRLRHQGRWHRRAGNAVRAVRARRERAASGAHGRVSADTRTTESIMRDAAMTLPQHFRSGMPCR